MPLTTLNSPFGYKNRFLPATKKMNFICYSHWDQLPVSANALFEQAEKGSVFFSRPWFECLSAVERHDRQTMVLACVVTDNTVLAILPLMENAGNTWHSLIHKYTANYSLLLADDDQSQVLTCLAQGLSQLPFNGLILEPIIDEDNQIGALRRAMEMAGFRCDRYFRDYNWIYRVQESSYEDYMAARPATLRNTISRKKRKLEREHGYDIRLFTGDEVPQAMGDYYTVYTASWKQNEQNADFVDNVVAAFSRVGWNRLAVLYIKGQPVAAQLWFVQHARASIFRLAYDKVWKRYSPGSILTSFLMRHVIDTDGVREIDFLSGNDAYKQDWMSERRECFALCFIKQTRSAGRFERFIESLKRTLKRW